MVSLLVNSTLYRLQTSVVEKNGVVRSRSPTRCSSCNPPISKLIVGFSIRIGRSGSQSLSVGRIPKVRATTNWSRVDQWRQAIQAIMLEGVCCHLGNRNWEIARERLYRIFIAVEIALIFYLQFSICLVTQRWAVIHAISIF